MKSIVKRLRGNRKKKEKVSSFLGSSGETADSSRTSSPGHGTPDHKRKPLQLQDDDDDRTHPMQEQSLPENQLEKPTHEGQISNPLRRRNSPSSEHKLTSLFGAHRRSSGRNVRRAPGQPQVKKTTSPPKVSSATLKRRSRLAAHQNQNEEQPSPHHPPQGRRSSRIDMVGSIGSELPTPRESKVTKHINLQVITASSSADTIDTENKTVSNKKKDPLPRNVPNAFKPHRKKANVSSSQSSTTSSKRQQQDQKEAAERIARAAAALDNQGNDLFERGKFDKAMAIYMKALKLKRRTFHSLLDDADDILDEAILQSEEQFLEDGETTTKDQKLLLSMATSINNIGYLRQRSGDATPEETMKAYKKSLRIKKKILGSDSLSVGKTLNNIGSVHYLKGEFEGALKAYQEALHVMEANLGHDHPDVATVWSNMGDVNLGMRSKQEALSHYRNALNIRWSVFGEHDPRVVRLLEKIAAVEITDKMMANTPMAHKRNIFGWDETDLYDLDTLPVAQELHALRGEVEEDMQFVDLMEKKVAVDMVKDKVQILKGMRELMGNDDDKKHVDDSEAHDNDSTGSLGMEHHEYQSLAQGSNAERMEALKSVKDRLARIRASKEHDGHDSMPNLDDHPAAELFRSSFYCTQARMTSLATLDHTDLKEGVETLRSALVLKKGIDNLRLSHNVEGQEMM